MTNSNSRRDFLISLWTACLVPAAASAADAGKAPAPTPTPNYELIPLDPARKAQTELKDVHPEILEQKGLGMPVFPDSEGERKKFESARKIQDLCREVEGKVVAYVGETALVEGCRQRAIDNVDLLNEILLHTKTNVVDIPAHVYREIPRGTPMSTAELQSRVEKFKQDELETRRQRDLCARLNGGYATVSGDEFYFVEKCRKRAFRSYQELVEHNKESRPVVGISPADAAKIPSGEPMTIKARDEQSLLYRIDGDVVWSRLYGGGDVSRESEDSFEKLSQIESEKKRPIVRNELCKSIGGRVVSFFSKIYFIENCQRRLVPSLSLELQQTLADGKGIVDITSDQYRALPEGKDIAAEDVLKKLK